MIAQGSGDATIQNTIDNQMQTIFRVVGICLGIPNESFTWEYYDKNKAYHSIGPLSPVEFYEKYVKNSFNVDEKVSGYKLILNTCSSSSCIIMLEK